MHFFIAAITCSNDCALCVWWCSRSQTAILLKFIFDFKNTKVEISQHIWKRKMIWSYNGASLQIRKAIVSWIIRATYFASYELKRWISFVINRAFVSNSSIYSITAFIYTLVWDISVGNEQAFEVLGLPLLTARGAIPASCGGSFKSWAIYC